MKHDGKRDLDKHLRAPAPRDAHLLQHVGEIVDLPPLDDGDDAVNRRIWGDPVWRTIALELIYRADPVPKMFLNTSVPDEQRETLIPREDLPPSVPTVVVLPRPANIERAAVRSVPLRRFGARDPESTAEAVSATAVRRQLLRESQPTVPTASDRAVYGALRRADQ